MPSGSMWRMQLLRLADLPFISPDARVRPDTYTTPCARPSPDRHHARFFLSLPSSHRYTVTRHPNGRYAAAAAAHVLATISSGSE